MAAPAKPVASPAPQNLLDFQRLVALELIVQGRGDDTIRTAVLNVNRILAEAGIAYPHTPAGNN